MQKNLVVKNSASKFLSKKSLLIGLSLSFILLIIAVFMGNLGIAPQGDVPLYQIYYTAMIHGHGPYTGLQLEYLPGVLPFILVAGFLGHLVQAYDAGYILLSTVAFGLLLSHVYQRFGRKTLIILCLAILPLLRFVFFELDIFAAIPLYASVYYLTKSKFGRSAVLLALSTYIKTYPGVCLLGLIWFIPKTKRLRYLVIFFGALLIGLLPFAIIAPHGLWNSVAYHTGRPVEWASSGAAVGYILHLLGHPAQVIATHKSNALIFAGEPFISGLSSALLAAGLIFMSYKVLKGRLKVLPATSSLIMILIYILFFKVSSPQYLVVAISLLPLVIAETARTLARPLVARLFVLALVQWVLFLAIFNLYSPRLTTGFTVMAATLTTLRALLIAELIIFLYRKASRPKQPA